jgi:hypothetical protein
VKRCTLWDVLLSPWTMWALFGLGVLIVALIERP